MCILYNIVLSKCIGKSCAIPGYRWKPRTTILPSKPIYIYTTFRRDANKFKNKRESTRQKFALDRDDWSRTLRDQTRDRILHDANWLRCGLASEKHVVWKQNVEGVMWL